MSGELLQTTAYQMRMSTLSAEDPEGPAEQRHNIEVYFPDVYDEETAKEVRINPAWGWRLLTCSGYESPSSASWLEVVWGESRSLYCDWFVGYCHEKAYLTTC